MVDQRRRTVHHERERLWRFRWKPVVIIGRVNRVCGRRLACGNGDSRDRLLSIQQGGVVGETLAQGSGCSRAEIHWKVYAPVPRTAGEGGRDLHRRTFIDCRWRGLQRHGPRRPSGGAVADDGHLNGIAEVENRAGAGAASEIRPLHGEGLVEFAAVVARDRERCRARPLPGANAYVQWAGGRIVGFRPAWGRR